LVSAIQAIVAVVVAYLVAVSLYLIVVKISSIPQGELWDDGLKVAFQFVAIAIIVIGLLIPTFQKEWDSGLRTFSLFTATMLVGYTVFRVAGLNPDRPLDLLLVYVVDPILRWVRTLRT
jgi:hypothetical protein